MPAKDRTAESKSRFLIHIPVAMAPCLLGLLLCGAGCMTRSSTPVWGADSTLVYPSKLPNDVNATIAFQLKDSALRDTQKKADKDRAREISRLRKDRAKLIATLDKQQEQLRKAEAKRKAEAEKKTKRAAKKKKTKRSADEAAAVESGRSPLPAVETQVRAPDPALRDSLASIEDRLNTLLAEDSVAALAPWRIKRADGKPAEEHVFDLEEGARIQAMINLDSVYARGKRPLMFHFVWLNPERKKVFKRMLEYVPNDSTQFLTSYFTISPAKRSSGHYSLQVFLFREQIAEKAFELRGKGVEEQEGGGAGGM